MERKYKEWLNFRSSPEINRDIQILSNHYGENKSQVVRRLIIEKVKELELKQKGR